MKKLICIDAGHGGKDSGAIGANNTQEKDLALDVALRLNQLLSFEGFYSFLTRYKDKYLKLDERAKVANIIGADIFISLHFNAAENKNANGTEVLYYPSKSSKELATIINGEIKKLRRVNRGIKQRENLVVLNSTKMPAVLVEGGFLSNLEEEKIINRKSYRQGLAEAITVGIINYFSTKNN